MKDNAFLRERSYDITDTMTVQGTIHKGITGLALCFLAAMVSWHYSPVLIAQYGQGFVMTMSFIYAPVAIGLVFLTAFKKTWSHITAPAYALVAGAFLGVISWVFEAGYQGIVIQAIMVTFGVLGSLLILYRTRMITVNDKFRAVTRIGIFTIFGVYLVSFVMSLFGSPIPFIHEGGPIGIGFSLLVIGLASMALLVDFNTIERGAEMRAPKHMEWYAVLGLLVTLVWLYIEVLQLLAKARR